MKKLAVVLAVVVSGFVIGQEFDLTNSISEMNHWLNTTHMYKTGDNDKAATIGILKDIFTDPDAKFKYEKINPRIAQLQVNGYVFEDTVSYSKWIASIPVYDTSKYEFIYKLDNNGIEYSYNPDITIYESISVYVKTTREFVREIFIVYNRNNFRLISDSNISNGKIK